MNTTDLRNKGQSLKGKRVYYYFSWNSKNGPTLVMCASERALESLLLYDFPHAVPRVDIFTGIMSDLTAKQKYLISRKRVRHQKYLVRQKYESIIKSFLAHIFYDADETRSVPTLPEVFKDIRNVGEVYDYKFDKWTFEQIMQVGQACDSHDYFQDRKLSRNK